MSTRTVMQASISAELGFDVMKFIRDRMYRESYASISRSLQEQTGVLVKPETIRRWVYTARTGR